MKRIALTSALVLGLAAPVFAMDGLTAHQLATLEAVSTSEDDFATEAFKREQFATGGIVSTQSGVSAGHAQLAANYGLDAADYSVAQLVTIAGENNEEERDRLIAAYKGNGSVVSTQSVTPDHVLIAQDLFGGPENNREYPTSRPGRVAAQTTSPPGGPPLPRSARNQENTCPSHGIAPLATQLAITSVDDALTMMQEAFGAYRAVLGDLDDEKRIAAWEEIRACLEEFSGPDGVRAGITFLLASGAKKPD